jgi:hypothetical protein
MRLPGSAVPITKVQHRLRGNQHGRRAGKRLIEPRPQLTMRKEIHPQQGDPGRQRRLRQRRDQVGGLCGIARRLRLRRYADIDRLFREQATEVDKGKREAMLHRIHEKAMFAPIWELVALQWRSLPSPGHPFLAAGAGRIASCPARRASLTSSLVRSSTFPAFSSTARTPSAAFVRTPRVFSPRYSLSPVPTATRRPPP